MAWGNVSWQFRDEAIAAKLAQMVENDRVHDHRADGTQGAALVENWVDLTATIVAAAGWAKYGTLRARRLLGGALVEYDMAFRRTGAVLVALADNSSYPGNMADTIMCSGIPASHQVGSGQIFWSTGGGSPVAGYPSGDNMIFVMGVTSGRFETNDVISCRMVFFK